MSFFKDMTLKEFFNGKAENDRQRAAFGEYSWQVAAARRTVLATPVAALAVASYLLVSSAFAPPEINEPVTISDSNRQTPQP